jgi:cell wall-associated NlpC family hydrolase
MKQYSRHFRYGLLVVLALICSACAGRTPPEPAAPVTAPDPSDLTPTRRIIVQAAMESMGAPYRWGGHTPEQGFDCSGLVVYAYQTAGLPLPRTAREQFQQGKQINRRQLLPGDLVFFNIPRKRTDFHVGIYTGSNRFIHAPGRKRQVIRSDLDNPYFHNNYAGARSFF